MKHSKWIAAAATAGGLLAVGSAHAIAPAAALGIAAIAGAAVGNAAAQAGQPTFTVVQPAPVAVVTHGSSTTVMGAGPVVQETITAPVTNYRWQEGRHEIHNGVTVWVPGHWQAETVMIYQN